MDSSVGSPQKQPFDVKHEPVEWYGVSGEMHTNESTSLNETQNEVLWESRTVHKTTWETVSGHANRRKTIVLTRYFSCQRCSKHYDTETEIEQHTETHRSVLKTVHPIITSTCDQCEATLTNNAKSNNLCESCDENSKNKVAMKIQYFKCQNCDAILNKMENLFEHICSQPLVKESDKSMDCQRLSVSSAVAKMYRTIAPKVAQTIQIRPTVLNTVFENNKTDNIVTDTNSESAAPSIANTCDICAVRFKSKFRLRMHMVTHTGEHQCNRCGRRFNQAYYLEKHRLFCYDKTRAGAGILHERAFATERRLWKCDLCDKKVRSKASLQQHIHTHTGERPYKCNCCGESFRTKSNLNIHGLTHKGVSEDNPYQCYMCELCLPSMEALQDHISTNHTGDKPFKCVHCDRSFAKRCSLGIHVAARHYTGPQKKLLKCELCDKLLKNKGTLRRHIMKLHTSGTTNKSHNLGKTFECKECGVHFLSKAGLISHTKSHLNEDHYKCEKCELGFKTAYSMEIHNKKLHKGTRSFQCDECSMSFTIFSSLKRHKSRTHNGERPYVCTICSKGLTSRHGLEQHTNMHTGARPYVCERCGMAFASKANHYTHLQRHLKNSRVTADTVTDPNDDDGKRENAKDNQVQSS